MNIKRMIFEYLVHCQTDSRVLPDLDTLRRVFGGVSNDVDLCVAALEREGLLSVGSKDDGEIALIATIGVVPKIWLRNSEPFISRPPAATMIEGSIVVDLRGIGIVPEPDMYAMQAFDDSMSDAGIRCGDTVILAHGPYAKGDIVAVELDGRLVLRRYIIISQIPHILAENPSAPDLRPAFDLVFQGTFWGLIRTERSFRRALQQKSRITVSYSKTVPLAQPAQGTMKVKGRSSPLPALADNVPRRLSGASRAKKHGADKSQDQNYPDLESMKSSGHWPEPPTKIGLNEHQETGYDSRTNSSDARGTNRGVPIAKPRTIKKSSIRVS